MAQPGSLPEIVYGATAPATGATPNRAELAKASKAREKEMEIRRKIEETKREIAKAQGNMILENALRRALAALEQTRDAQRRFRRTKGPVDDASEETDQAAVVATPTAKTVSLSRGDIAEIERRQKNCLEFVFRERNARLLKELGVQYPIVADAQRRADAAEAAAGRR